MKKPPKGRHGLVNCYCKYARLFQPITYSTRVRTGNCAPIDAPAVTFSTPVAIW